MAAFCYILHSESLGKFYIGVTSLKPEERLEFHLDGRYGKKSFSAAANDWKIFYTIECESSRQAMKIEGHIKRMKSKRYIRNLLKYSEITEKLKLQYPV